MTPIRNVPVIVDVWIAYTDEWLGHEEVLWQLLDASERDRADRFHFERDRVRHLIAHGLLRTVLAPRASADPRALRFVTGEWGKPGLASPGSPGVEFNLSHSDNVVAIAVAGVPVGIDVERRGGGFDPMELAQQFFSAREQAELAAIRPDARMNAFFACWTRKEAYIKATGLGVSRGLDYFDVTVAPDGPGALIADRLAPDAPRDWSMMDLHVPTEFAGSLVVRSPVARMRQSILKPELAGHFRPSERMYVP